MANGITPSAQATIDPVVFFQSLSPFFTMDLAQAEDGHWFIMEIGDGQVAGLPDGIPPQVLFSALQPSP